MFRHFDSLKGYDIQGTDDRVGYLKDILFDDQTWQIRYFVVDTSKWMPASRKVLLSPHCIVNVETEQERLVVNLSRQEIKDSPPLEEHEPVSRHYEAKLFQYYGYSHYWLGDGLAGTYPRSAPFVDDEALPDEHLDEPHLRSVREVSGYEIKARDSAYGHVKDVVVDESNWSIPFIQVATRNWLPGGDHLLLTSNHTEHLSWQTQSLEIDLTVDELKAKPLDDYPHFEDSAVQLNLKKYLEAEQHA